MSDWKSTSKICAMCGKQSMREVRHGLACYLCGHKCALYQTRIKTHPSQLSTTKFMATGQEEQEK